MYRPLLPCPGCARHVRTSEHRCPFCETELAALGSAARAEMPPGVATRGLSRAALVMLGASIAVTACGSPPPPPTPDAPVTSDTPPPDPAGPADDDGAAAPEYGAPVQVDEPDEASGPPDDNGGMMTKYGAPPPDDR
jgi:hypothetical protein